MTESWFVKIPFWCRQATMVGDGAYSHNIDYTTILKEILNLKGHQNHIAGSKIMLILLNV